MLNLFQHLISDCKKACLLQEVPKRVRDDIMKGNSKLDWEKAGEIQENIENIVEVLKLEYINPKRIFCFRTHGSKSKSYARIWSFPKIFQTALKIEPAYVIEVLAKHFDKLKDDEKKKVLIHELLHVPKNFSGALLPHRSRGRHLHKMVDQLFKEYKKSESLK